jgi:two-component system chemotaxis response regulator CheB
VVGASAGGIQALSQIVPLLPEDLPAAVVVVVHLAPASRSALPAILARKTLLQTASVHDGELIEHGHIYVAPPDRHVLIEGDRLRLIRGPRENGHRPAIDATFRSAVRSYGPRVTGVVLSGNLGDGTAGLRLVGEAGGVTIAQDPDDALHPSMPLHAIEYGDPQHVVPAVEIAALITHFASQPVDGSARGEDAESFWDGQIQALSCPECGGPIAQVGSEDDPRFVCRVGHGFSPESLFAEQAQGLEAALWAAVRALEERGDLATRLAERLENRGADLAGARFRTNADDVGAQAAVLRRVLESLDACADDVPAGQSEDEPVAVTAE